VGSETHEFGAIRSGRFGGWKSLSEQVFLRMANIKSQIKRNRQNEAARLRNKAVRSALKTKTKRFEQALEAGDTDAATEAYSAVTKAYDQAAAKSVVHKNKAANKKSRLAKRLNG
jgi:small subunit ribosomal protein S20